MTRASNGNFFRIGLFAALALLWTGSASAVPSYARQTGQACATCHVGAFGPQLNSFGRQFKLLGYTMSDGKSGAVPLSAMLVESYTHTQKDLSDNAGPHDGPNDNAALQQLSLFVAGKLTKHIGMFSQVTYSDIDRKVAMDNFDIRYATPFSRGAHAGVFGVSVNNNPGVSDLRHTLAAWRFPFISSEFTPGPIASPLIDGGLGQQVIGADAYVSLDSKFYGSFGLYKTLSRSLLDEMNVDYGGRISGAAPYWRFAWEPQLSGQSLSLGVFGLDARLQPDGRGTPTDKYNDYGFDAAYERPMQNGDMLTVNGSFTHESNRLNSAFIAGEADRAGHSLSSTNFNASYYFHNTYGLSFGWFNVSGTRDLSLYAAEPDFGSNNGSPSSRGEVLQADWTPFGKSGSWKQPWANLRLGVQYTHFDQLNGAGNNYDGFGRNASDNDTLFVFAWFAL
jgi:hypothetical protein